MIEWNQLIKAETVKEQTGRIEQTDWRTVLNHLLLTRSEIAQIILVNCEEDLPRVAAFFVDPQIDDNTDTLFLMNEFKAARTFALVFNRNKIEGTNLENPQIVGENIEKIPLQQSAKCIFAPPCSIVHIEDVDKLIGAFGQK